MTSTKPVNVYVVLCQGTIDRKLESLVQDKGDAAELVLDGRLIGERTEEINLAELLRVAHREFDADTATLDEALLHRQWPALRDRLARAMRAWDATPGIPLAIPLTTARSTTIARTGPTTIAVQTSAPAPDWKARVAARAARLAQTQRSSNLWSQF
ncbi:MAG: hypothetical protein ACLQU3_03570 [Limisphaerales bacterium]